MQGRPDPRDPEAARPRRLAAGGRRIQSFAVGVRRAAGAVRLSVVDQGHYRTPDHVVAAPQEGTAAAQADGGDVCATGSGGHRRVRLKPPSFFSITQIFPKIWNDRCRVFTTALLRSPTSTKVRAIRSCSCMALRRPRM